MTHFNMDTNDIIGTKIVVPYRKTTPLAITPKYCHEGDSGMDVFSLEEVILHPLDRQLIGTGLTFDIPANYEIQVRPKSGLALKHGITVLNTPGTIDASYKGEVKVMLINLSQEVYKVEVGQKIAQIVFAPVITAALHYAEVLSDSSRGADGFGSTGIF